MSNLFQSLFVNFQFVSSPILKILIFNKIKWAKSALSHKIGGKLHILNPLFLLSNRKTKRQKESFYRT
jgi:hypothetical protein